MKSNSGEIRIHWTDKLSGDFSFKDDWSYPEGVFRNEFGQLICDGICPPELDNMKDENGRIIDDSLVSYYNLVDTTHLFHSIKSEAWAYEWAGTHYITAKRINKDTVICFTLNNVSTHSSLNLIITRDIVKPAIILHSVMSSSGTKIYNCTGGEMNIEQDLWEKGILKASFSFTFDHKENPNRSMYWDGNIYAEIEDH